MKLRRGVRGQHDLCMNNAAFTGVVVGQTVPLVHQLFTAPIGGSGNSRFTLASLNYLDCAMENCDKQYLLVWFLGVWGP